MKQCLKSSFSWIMIAIIMVSLFGCEMSGQKYISRREPNPVVANTKVAAPNVEPVKESKPSDLYTRNKEVKIRRRSPINETGSLTDLNDPRAYLFGFERPLDIGSFVDIKVVSNRAEAKSDNKVTEQKAADTKDSQTGKPDEAANLLKSLPNLEPADGNYAGLIKNIKMQVIEKLPNGDVLVMHRRRSLRDGQASEINVTARMPALALARVDNLSTVDLADIDWRESSNGEIAERKSANWEDEYTARLSGFEESRSKQAMAIEEKREQVKSARSNLEKEMKAFMSDRDKMTKERASLLETKAKDDEKIAELESRNQELQRQVDESANKDDSGADDVKNNDSKSEKKDAAKTDKKETNKGAQTKSGKTADKKADTKKPNSKEEKK